MKAFILAAGLGTRLGNMTKDRPKALVKINGEELLALTIRRLKEQGFSEFVINIHHYGEMVKDFLRKHNNFGVTIHISDEQEELLDTGGALLKAGNLLEGKEPVLVHNVDIISEVDFGKLLDFHTWQQALATLCVRDRLSDRKLLFDKQWQLKGWTNQKTGEFKWSSSPVTDYQAYAFSGIYVISPQFIRKIKQKGKFSIIDTWLDLAGKNKIVGYLDKSEYWFDLGTPDKIKKAELYLKNKGL
jgi:NDP-sugar pyrophosphorylase family protein